ncbi:Crp/Fnr family transcriptional regulator [Mucilaginibacter sp. dw_454]|uniref:Crp/Fnr family transcriptional regulator n=1 Tax=Mucilaginibacter sp. dw_454 TaxID=2720079 RepID=UPI001BD2FB76|nr:Crp/Fnr family transcriptional regulator [Mucilaginibacter sp. dw_454]
MSSVSINHPDQVRAAWKKYYHLWKREDVGAKHVLLKEGDISRKVYMIEKGCVRNWFNHNGKEISFQFFFEGDVVYSAESFRKNIPSVYTIETIEPVSLRWLSQKDMELIREDLLLYNEMIRRAVDKQAEFMRHFFSYLRDTPKERYELLLYQNPEIIKRVPLQHIASYLGITAVSLSRIRNRI